MLFVLFSILILVACAVLSLLISDRGMRGAVSCIGVSAASLVGLLSVFLPSPLFQDGLTVVTNIPFIRFSFGLDALSQFFLIVIYLLSFLVGIYGFGYTKGQKQLLGTSPFFPLLVAAMAGVTVSRDGFSFIIIWEVMSLASFFLVTTEHEKKEVQYAGWVYLIATHLATAFLMAFFALMAKTNGSFLFADFTAGRALDPVLAGTLFIFALIGFGTKAGVFPMHVWLPHAHPSAPSHISALMSGVMIKTGIYGILRALTFLGTPPVWWGALLVVAGIASAVIGVLYALMQHDLKRLLAYHSVENIGIIVTGIGVGMIGVSNNNMMIAALGFGGALFHVLNHAVFKGLLFLCAGNLLHAAHSLSIERFGGLMKKMPVTGIAFLVAAVAICGLPPLNGFISEWIVYSGLFSGAKMFSGYAGLLTVAGILGIAFAGGLAIACFAKVFGVVFLGEPRGEMTETCREPSNAFIFPMMVLASLCFLIGLFPSFIWPVVLSAAGSVAPGIDVSAVASTSDSLTRISVVFASLIGMVALSMLVRKFLFRKKEVRDGVTWDCGYESPAASMQYTASSFAEPIGTFFGPLLRPSIKSPAPSGVFPAPAVFEEHISDCAEGDLFEPAFRGVGSAILFLRKKKKSTVQSYLVLIFITLIVLFVLEVWFGI